MNSLTVHTQDTAPAASQPVSQPILESVQNAYRFLPNLFGVFAESPAMAEAYATVSAIFDKTDLTPTERQIVLMTNNRLNECTYCMAAHTTISQMQGVDGNVIESLRNGTALADAGFTKANILDVILGTSFKTLSNYTNHVAETPLDDAFKTNAWKTPNASAA